MTMLLLQSPQELRQPGELRELRFLKTATGVTAWELQETNLAETFEGGVIRVDSERAFMRVEFAGGRCEI